ncbi:MAG: hypothetical protein ACYTHM_16265 [Planctomycetota bacterium]|jgi:hypothetical protein
MYESDFILRMIHQLTLALSRILKARGTGDSGWVEKEIEDAYQSVFGADQKALRILDPKAVAKLFGEPERIQALGRLTVEEGTLALDKGDREAAKKHFQRALDLFEEAQGLRKKKDGEIESICNRIKKRLDKLA